MSGSLRDRAKAVLSRADPETLIRGRYSVKTRPKCFLSFFGQGKGLKVASWRDRKHTLWKHRADVNFDSDKWVVVKMPVTINSFYNRPVSKHKWMTQHCRGRKLLPHPVSRWLCQANKLSTFKLIFSSTVYSVQFVPRQWVQRSSPGLVVTGCLYPPPTF